MHIFVLLLVGLQYTHKSSHSRTNMEAQRARERLTAFEKAHLYSVSMSVWGSALIP